MNVEHLLVSNLVQTGAFPVLQRSGTTPEDMFSVEAREALKWVLEHRRLYNTMPSPVLLRQTFPNFPFHPTDDTVDALAEEVGKNARRVRATDMLKRQLRALEAGQDPDGILSGLGENARGLMRPNSQSGFYLEAGMSHVRDRYRQRKESGGIIGIPFPWGPMNTATQGAQGGQFIAIFGRPKEGKTWIALRILAYAYMMGYRVLCYSREMSVLQLTDRMVCLLTETYYGKLANASLDEYEEASFYQAMETLLEEERTAHQGGNHRAMFFYSDMEAENGGTVSDLEVVAREVRPDIILTDGFYHMMDSVTKLTSRDVKQVSNISMQLKRLARQLNVPIIGTTQANRSGHKTAGKETTEVAFSDAIVQDVDLACKVTLIEGPRGRDSAQLITAPAMRDGKFDPFTLNFYPGADHSLWEANVDAEQVMAAQAQRAKVDAKNKPPVDPGPVPQRGSFSTR